MIRVIVKSGLLGALLLTSCQQNPTPISLLSLAQSGAMSMVCRNMTTGQGDDIRGCPDPYATTTDGRHTMLLVTQVGRGEVAVIDMHTRTVLDQDPTVPGTEFLPIGAMPVSIASTPGGAATFVATADPGREGIFVLPTSCIVAPQSGEPQHDLTRWSACRLPSAPGEMVVVTDAAVDSAGEPRRSCDGSIPQDSSTHADCPVDWAAEQRVGPAGRRKLLVTLPKKGRLAILDARQLANRDSGKFEDCTIERLLPLTTQVPTSAPEQSIPRDLQEPGCPNTPNYTYAASGAFFSQPAGVSLKDGKLYVSDLGVPLVHVVDVSDPCAPHETDPLLPASFDEPTRAVYTSAVAVSEVTSRNEQFVYAVDDGNGSLMAFDISKAQRTPMVRTGEPYQPDEAPDRIRTSYLNSRVKDLLFIKHDVPIVDPGVLTSPTGVLCDPDPNAQPPASEYRTASDYSRGASPIKLRGNFAVAALSNGYVAVVDVDDWDAKCRRPIVANTAVTPADAAPPPVDWRGCHDDPADIATNPNQPYGFIDSTQARTTSDEQSCNVVEPHQLRAAHFMGNNTSLGVASPSLQAFPILTSVATTAAAGGSNQVTAQPKMLAVPFAGDAAGAGTEWSELYVGPSHYYARSDRQSNVSAIKAQPSNATLLLIDPSRATQNSLFLPQVEPRAYLSSESFSATFEGKLFADRSSGYLSGTSLTLSDPDANFCDQGVQDVDTALGRAADFIAKDPSFTEKQALFGSKYADLVQITSDFSDSDPYWVTPVGSSCARDPVTLESGITACRSYFGTTLGFTSARDWQITEAYQDHLVFQPIAENVPDNNTARAIANLHCCFPGTISYTVRGHNEWVFRGQQLSHNIVVGANARCVPDDPACHRKQFLRDRIIEISSTGCNGTGHSCAIGASTKDDVACVVPDQSPIDPDFYAVPTSNSPPGLGLGRACVFDTLRARFAIYRGSSPSLRDMSYVWQVVGGFLPYELNLTNRLTGSAVMPESLTPAPNLNALFVVDGVSGGVFEITLDPFGIAGDPYL